MKKLIIAIAFILLVGVIGCGEKSTESVIFSEPIKIGWVGPLSGDGASWGADNLIGVQTAVQQINDEEGIAGRQVDLIIEDSALEETKMLGAYQKFTTFDDVYVILSPDYGGLLAISTRADQEKVVIVDSLDTSEELARAGEYLFAIGIHDENIGYELANYAYKTLGKRRIAVLYNEDPVTSLVDSAFERKFTELGGEVVVSERYLMATTDFRTPLAKIQDSGVDTLVVLGYDEAGLIYRQAKQLNSDFILMGMDTVTSANFLRNAQEAVEGTYFTSWDATSTLYQKLEQRIVQVTGKKPEQPLFSAAGYDAAMFVAQAMQKGVRGEALASALYTSESQKGVTGDLVMSPDGIVRSVSEQIFQVRGEEFVKIE